MHDRVTNTRGLSKAPIDGVGDHPLMIGCVDGRFVHLIREDLIVVYLPDLRSGPGQVRAVGEHPVFGSVHIAFELIPVHLRPVRVRGDVSMSRAALVMPGEQGRELDDTVLVGQLQTTRMGAIDVAGIVSVSVSLVDQTAIDPTGVRVPEVDHDVWQWLTGHEIEDLDIQNEVYARLLLPDIAADVFSRDVVGTFRRLGRQDAGVVPSKENIGWGVGRIGDGRQMTRVQDQLTVISCGKDRSIWDRRQQYDASGTGVD